MIVSVDQDTEKMDLNLKRIKKKRMLEDETNHTLSL
jgi:hypothetical protein